MIVDFNLKPHNITTVLPIIFDLKTSIYAFELLTEWRQSIIGAESNWWTTCDLVSITIFQTQTNVRYISSECIFKWWESNDVSLVHFTWLLYLQSRHMAHMFSSDFTPTKAAWFLWNDDQQPKSNLIEKL